LLENVTIEQVGTGEMRHMRAKIRWRGKVHFTAVGESGHEVPLDGPADAGGENRGSRPMELVLMGLGACTSYDVISILAKSRQDVVDCVTELDADRADSVPSVFERIHIHFVVTGRNLDEKRVARAVALSADKYCSASIMLERAGVQISHDYEIINVD
jgi:putative redox protein